MKKNFKKCVNCKVTGKHTYKKGAKYFCTQKCKNDYFNNDIPTLKNKIQVEFNRYITKDQSCSMCSNSYDKMDCSHILSRGSNDHLRFDFFNTSPMCSRCHRWKWHDDPLQGIEWFKNKYPERYDYLLFAKSQFKKWTSDELHKIRQAIKDNEPKKLVRFYKEYTQKLTLDKLK